MGLGYAVGDVEACNVMFVWEAARPLCFGRALAAVPDRVIVDTPLLLAFLGRWRVARVLTTPSLLATLLDTATPTARIRSSRIASISSNAQPARSALEGDAAPASSSPIAPPLVPKRATCGSTASWAITAGLNLRHPSLLLSEIARDNRD